LAWYDIWQRTHTIRRNFPVLGRFRYLAEMIRPEIQQYFVESDEDGRPFSRNVRSVVYARSKSTATQGLWHDVWTFTSAGTNSSTIRWRRAHCDPDSCASPLEGRTAEAIQRKYPNISAMQLRLTEQERDPGPMAGRNAAALRTTRAKED
jgi:hypothetical protein